MKISIIYQQSINKNIDTITLAMNAVDWNVIDSGVKNLKEVDTPTIQNSNDSIAEMSSKINNENYREPMIDYNKIVPLIKAISFIYVLIKKAKSLSKTSIISENNIDYNYKILIFQIITEEMVLLFIVTRQTMINNDIFQFRC